MPKRAQAAGSMIAYVASLFLWFWLESITSSTVPRVTSWVSARTRVLTLLLQAHVGCGWPLADNAH